ncbi:kanadaptin [Synchiropus picturatus]
MSASLPPDVSPSADKDASTVMDTEPAVENGEEKTPEPQQETLDTFKKPDIFKAPAVASKRSCNVAPSEAEPCGDSPAIPAPNEQVKPPKTEPDESKSKVASAPPVKPKVLPSKAPPAGKFPPLPYSEPAWGGAAPDLSYSLEILKNGTIINTIPLDVKSFFVVGRLPVCDMPLEHPSISRYHAVIQYRCQAGETENMGEERGFYVHDLGSTHGTVVNKNKIPPKTYIRIKVGHVLKFGGSTRLFILQGPEFDEEEESELTVTELRERAQKQKAQLEKRMMGENSDDEEEEEEEKEGDGESVKGQSKVSSEDSGCSWGMAEEAFPEEDENAENPFSTEFHEDQEAAYLKDPKKALQGFYDREGEELEFEYEDKNHGTWLCRIKLPVDDALGRQLVAEVTHTGKKKEAAVQCCLEACRMLEARGLLRQEAVSRKRKKKNWEDEDFYDSDDDTFLDRTGTVEKKRKERMKKAGKIEERPETYDSLLSKLAAVEKEVAETQKKLSGSGKDSSRSSADDPLDAFMTAVRSETAMDAVERKKLHLHVADLRKDAQRLRKLVELTRPAELPSLLPSGSGESEKPKKALPLFGAMKGGSKFKLKTGTIGKLPPKRPNLPAELFNMKELPPGGEEEEEEEEEEEDEKMEAEKKEESPEVCEESNMDPEDSSISISNAAQETEASPPPVRTEPSPPKSKHKSEVCSERSDAAPAPSSTGTKGEAHSKTTKKTKGQSRPPALLSKQYPDDDPDYCVWVPPAGQSGDGRTHLNDKFGY